MANIPLTYKSVAAYAPSVKSNALSKSNRKVEPRRQESAAPKSTFGSKSRRILMRHPVAEGAFIPRQNRGPSA